MTIATETTIPVTSLLEELRGIIDERETIAARDSTLSRRKSEIEVALLSYHDATGLESVKGGGMSVSFDGDACRAKYDPEKFNEIMAWAVATGNQHILQRRLTDARIVSLIKDGVALPDGLSVEPYTKISTRRI